MIACLNLNASAIICSLMGSSQERAIDYMCDLAGHERDTARKYFISTASNITVRSLLRHRSFDNSRICSIQPDILVCRDDIFGNVEIIVAIELKRSAQVNYVNCPSGRHLGYSNQIICYADNCWLSESTDSSNISYVWLCKESASSIDQIQKKALTGDINKDEKLGATKQAYEYQSHFLNEVWEICSFESFIESFKDESPIIVEKLGKWMSA